MCYLASIWTIELCIRYCDICKDFRVEIRAIHSSIFNDAHNQREAFCVSELMRLVGFSTLRYVFFGLKTLV